MRGISLFPLVFHISKTVETSSPLRVVVAIAAVFRRNPFVAVPTAGANDTLGAAVTRPSVARTDGAQEPDDAATNTAASVVTMSSALAMGTEGTLDPGAVPVDATTTDSPVATVIDAPAAAATVAFATTDMAADNAVGSADSPQGVTGFVGVGVFTSASIWG